MRKFIPFLFSGFAVLSYSALAADNPVSGADAKGDANRGAATASDNAVSEKRDAPEGTAKDSHQANPKAGKQAKRKKDQSGAGATGTERRY